jgi:hypothetical protein
MTLDEKLGCFGTDYFAFEGHDSKNPKANPSTNGAIPPLIGYSFIDGFSKVGFKSKIAILARELSLLSQVSSFLAMTNKR